MLGYIKAYKPELRIKEYEMYKAIYCSLCKQMGKRYGFLTRFTLSYDFTFLALLNMSLAQDTCSLDKGRCVCNPLKKCIYCKGSEELFAMPSAASVIMVYYNIRDNVEDERGIKKLFYRFLSLLFRRAHKKAAADYPHIEEAVKDYITKQSQLEKDNVQDMDAAAAPTSEVLSKIFPLCSQDEKEKRVLERLGYCLGRYIYLADARSDLDDDKKKGRYNPLISYGDGAERAERNIYMCIHESINAFELINIHQFKNILGNIIYMGLEDTYKRSLNNERSV